jgi:hypothetical protein
MEPLRGRPKVRHGADILVAEDGLMYVTDYDARLYVLQWDGQWGFSGAAHGFSRRGKGIRRNQ